MIILDVNFCYIHIIIKNKWYWKEKEKIELNQVLNNSFFVYIKLTSVAINSVNSDHQIFTKDYINFFISNSSIFLKYVPDLMVIFCSN